MYIIEGAPRGKEERIAIRAAAQEIRLLREGTPVQSLFGGHFERLRYHQPQQLREELLGTAVALGLEANEKKALKKIQLAADLAEAVHAPQTRKHSGDPYVVHPYRSAFLAMEMAAAMGHRITTELIVGALLHDAVEDHPELVTKAFLREQFSEFGEKYGKNIADDSYALSRKENGKVIPDEDYIVKIRDTRDRETLLRRYIIKTADRVDNLLDPPHSPTTTDENDPLRVKRQETIDKTQHDVLALLLDQPQEMEVSTDLLTTFVLTAVELSFATINTEAFNVREWEDYIQAA